MNPAKSKTKLCVARLQRDKWRRIARQLELFTQLLIGSREVFRNNARIADSGHEVCIAYPARQYMDMNMIHDTRPGRAAQIHADIEPCRLINIAQCRLATLSQIH